MIRKVYLHGSLAKSYGSKPLLIDAENMYVLTRGMFSMLGSQFKETIRNGSWNIHKGKRNDVNYIAASEINMGLGKSEEIHFYPAIKAQSGVLRVIVGIVLVVVGFLVPGAQPLIGIGASMALGGISQLLAPKPKMTTQTQQTATAANPSFIFNGTVNVNEQGGPPPLIYGRVQRASSLVLSAGLTVENIPL